MIIQGQNVYWYDDKEET